MDSAYDCLEDHKNHKECKHLYEFLDKSNYVTTQSMHGYLKSMEVENCQYFKSVIDPHPNAHGHMVWLDNILLPHLEQTGFFK